MAKKKKTVRRADTALAKPKRQNRSDGWSNVLTGFAKAANDKRMAGEVDYTPLAVDDAETLYGASDIAAKVVEELPQEALREGWEVTLPEKNDALTKALEAEVMRLEGRERLGLTWNWSRMYGGAGLVMMPKNVNVLSQPANWDSFEPIVSLLPLSRWELQNAQLDLDIRSPNFGLPEIYNLQPRGGTDMGAQLFKVHYSRVIRFDGVPLPRNLFVQNYYWSDSYLTRLRDLIRDYDSAHQGAAIAMQDFSVAVWKIQNLARMIAENGDEEVIKRMQLLNITRSVARCAALDAENESYEYQNRPFTGVPDVLERLGNRLVAACDHIPHTRLFGESPSGLGATGNSEQRDWYDYVARRQQSVLKPRALQLLRAICAQKGGPTGGKIPEGLDMTFPPLWQMDEKETAQAHLTQAQADQIYITEGVLDPSEVRDSRYAAGKYSYETKIDPTITPEPKGMDAQEPDQDDEQDVPQPPAPKPKGKKKA